MDKPRRERIVPVLLFTWGCGSVVLAVAAAVLVEFQSVRHMAIRESVYTCEGTHDVHGLILAQDVTGFAAYWRILFRWMTKGEFACCRSAFLLSVEDRDAGTRRPE